MRMHSMIVMTHGFRRKPRFWWRELLVAAKLNWDLVLLAFFFLAGMIIGAVYARNADSKSLENLDFLFAGNFKARESATFLSIFTASFASSFLFVLACFLCGLSMWGIFFIPFILSFRGFGLGLTSGYLYAVYGGKGILFNLMIILPGAFVCCFSILLAAREGIRFSRLLVSCGARATDRSRLKLYALHFGTVLGITFISAGIDLLLSACFGGLFSF